MNGDCYSWDLEGLTEIVDSLKRELENLQECDTLFLQMKEKGDENWKGEAGVLFAQKMEEDGQRLSAVINKTNDLVEGLKTIITGHYGECENQIAQLMRGLEQKIF